MKIESVEFVRSATGEGDLPDAGLPEFSMVGRSNVGKSTLINALVKKTIARTSAAPGKTRMINLYRVVARPTGEFYLVDLPGYGYARRKDAKAEFDRMAQAYFSRAGTAGPGPGGQSGSLGVRASGSRGVLTSGSPDVRASGRRRTSEGVTSGPPDLGPPGLPRVPIAVMLLVDARHPGLDTDTATAAWLRARGFDPLVVVTKLDKLSRSDRARSLREFDHLFGTAVCGVSAATGEGLEDLWKRMASWIESAADR